MFLSIVSLIYLFAKGIIPFLYGCVNILVPLFFDTVSDLMGVYNTLTGLS